MATPNCWICRFAPGGGSYECHRRAPTLGENGKAVWPIVYNGGGYNWCGDFEPDLTHPRVIAEQESNHDNT
jgi:hypothetical protein